MRESRADNIIHLKTNKVNGLLDDLRNDRRLTFRQRLNAFNSLRRKFMLLSRELVREIKKEADSPVQDFTVFVGEAKWVDDFTDSNVPYPKNTGVKT